ncbi:unnamed protein product [Choristocarpus tenellus]
MSILEDEDPSLLLVVLDASSAFWTKREANRMRPDQGADMKLSTFQETVEGTLLFVESYLMMHRRNNVCFVACSGIESTMLFPTAALEQEQRSLAAGSVSSKEFHEFIRVGLEGVVAREASRADSAAEGYMLAGGLSKGLCFINSKLQQSPSTQARVLILSGAPDVPEGYNAVMNAIFSAQKAGVLVDCCVLGLHSIFLQQAAYLTGGLYLQCREPGIVEYLIATFLPSQSCRKYLKLRKQRTVDFRAACFCHKRVVDIAYVCSVCLSVFCEFSPVCSTCGTRAWPKKASKSKKRPLKNLTNGQPGSHT